MRSSFIILIFLLFLSGCSEEKAIDKKEEIMQETSESIVPENNQTAKAVNTAQESVQEPVQKQIEEKQME